MALLDVVLSVLVKCTKWITKPSPLHVDGLGTY